MDRLTDSIVAAARAQGFILAGFAALRRLEHREPFLRAWLEAGRAGEMAYLARDPERRFDPRTLDPRLRSVVSLAYPYAAPARPRFRWPDELRGRIAAYALGPDYHQTVLARTRVVAAAIAAMRPAAITRIYVDTGPVLEREWAAESGLGWFGRNTNLLNVHHGSYFFLSEIFTDLEIDAAPRPARDHCGRCRRCLDLCPTNALADGYLIEPRRCISYLTIEHRGPLPHELRAGLGNWIFGCDICQEVCPWNESDGPGEPELAPALPELMALDDDGFRRRYGTSAIRRTKRRGLLRNVAVALGNSRNPAAIDALASALWSDPEPLVRSHSAWALGQIGGRRAAEALQRARRREPEAAVRAEIDPAIDAATGACALQAAIKDSTVVRSEDERGA
ncbi:MAG TPA: tRNA epoxyqueuosine(34) reductase QueG [Candidatus Binataceae bacterium]|nr:tRNA epoxyqueuosine(34) reductase QueG [Candidatus Binataceae bacterium]